jgi:hypothetical protein
LLAGLLVSAADPARSATGRSAGEHRPDGAHQLLDLGVGGAARGAHALAGVIIEQSEGDLV